MQNFAKQHTQSREKDKRLIIGITHGDFNGISYEVIIKALNDKRILELFTPIIYGHSKVLYFHRKTLNFNDFNYKVINDVKHSFHQKINIINVNDDEVRIEHGKSTQEAGSLAFKALELAVDDLKNHKIHAVITAPINKSNIQSESFDFPGHTEYFTQRLDCKSLMLMVNDNLRIGVVTGHIPLKNVPEIINESLISEKIEILHQSLIKDFGIEKPKIAILGLNPHAGDHGLIGDEDDHIINPAIIKAKKHGKLVYGPFSADGFFGSDEYSKYDAILAMYHDQGLIPFKTLAFEGGVNYTAGLPFVRTSPAHGTAYEKAGKNIASPVAMRQAIYLALDIYRKRKAYYEMNKDPLGSRLSSDFINDRHSGEHEALKEVQD